MLEQRDNAEANSGTDLCCVTPHHCCSSPCCRLDKDFTPSRQLLPLATNHGVSGVVEGKWEHLKHSKHRYSMDVLIAGLNKS